MSDTEYSPATGMRGATYVGPDDPMPVSRETTLRLLLDSGRPLMEALAHPAVRKAAAFGRFEFTHPATGKRTVIPVYPGVTEADCLEWLENVNEQTRTQAAEDDQAC